jgi:hypothetical protein
MERAAIVPHDEIADAPVMEQMWNNIDYAIPSALWMRVPTPRRIG